MSPPSSLVIHSKSHGGNWSGSIENLSNMDYSVAEIGDSIFFRCLVSIQHYCMFCTRSYIIAATLKICPYTRAMSVFPNWRYKSLQCFNKKDIWQENSTLPPILPQFCDQFFTKSTDSKLTLYHQQTSKKLLVHEMKIRLPWSHFRLKRLAPK